MKKIIAILENRSVGPSRKMLARLGVVSVVLIPVREECGGEILLNGPGARPITTHDISAGCSRRHGWQAHSYEACDEPERITPPTDFRPKSMLFFVIDDEDAGLVVRSLIRLNEEVLRESGKIFVCPLISALG